MFYGNGVTRAVTLFTLATTVFGTLKPHQNRTKSIKLDLFWKCIKLDLFWKSIKLDLFRKP